MDRRRLGSTELEVSEIGLGCQSLGGGLYHRDDREATTVVLRAADAGISFFDTADHYSLGRSESLIGKTFRGRRHSVVLSTKVGTTYSPVTTLALRARPLLRPLSRALRPLKLPLHRMRAAQRGYDFSPEHLEQAVHKCLRRLRTDYLDLLLLHKPPPAELQRSECFDALQKLRSQGKIRYYGVSCDGVEDAHFSLGIPEISAIQIGVSLLDQAAVAEILPLAERRNCAVIARNPRGQGHLTSDLSDIMAETYAQDAAEAELRREVAKCFSFLVNEQRSMAQAAIRFVQQFSAVSVVIPRAVTIEQLNDVLATPRAPPISVQEMARIAATTAKTCHMLKSHAYRQ